MVPGSDVPMAVETVQITSQRRSSKKIAPTVREMILADVSKVYHLGEKKDEEGSD